MLFLNILCGLWVANNVHNTVKDVKDNGLIGYVISTIPAVGIVRGLQENESLKNMFGKDEKEEQE